MVTFTNHRGITLSAHAVQNGAALHVRPVTTPGAGDYAERETGRERRRVRRERANHLDEHMLRETA